MRRHLRKRISHLLVITVIAVLIAITPMKSHAVSNCSHNNLSWRTYDHWKGTHTYEQFCTYCNTVLQSFTRSCVGNCPEFNFFMMLINVMKA